MRPEFSITLSRKRYTISGQQAGSSDTYSTRSPCAVVCAAMILLFGTSVALGQQGQESKSALVNESYEVDRNNQAYEKRRAAAHSRMPNTLYASTPSLADSPHGTQPIDRAKEGLTSDQFGSTIAPHILRRILSSEDDGETAEEYFRKHISEQIVQEICVGCHVEGGLYSKDLLIFIDDENEDHEEHNFEVFQNVLEAKVDGKNFILTKIRGVAHGGGPQVRAGSQNYDRMERFLTLLSGQPDEPVVVAAETLFDDVGLSNDRDVLRKAALIFAGRVPTDQEYKSIDEVGLAVAVRNLMVGPGFHEFLIRSSNDRLLTDREGHILDRGTHGPFVEYINKINDFCEDVFNRGDSTDRDHWERAVQYAAVRAPLELIAHVVESDLSYTKILTAEYTMANPQAAEAYGASILFDDPEDIHEFKPVTFAQYFLNTESRKTRNGLEGSDCRGSVLDPGELALEYPHAGILNSPVFMKRYPTTATNRNRARSRWTYYHFLGFDIENSENRTTDPEALADTNNPTLNNSACTACHTILDPVAGSYQNYDEIGSYRSAWGGKDSLDDFYKNNPPGGEDFLVEASSIEERETVVAKGYMRTGENTIGIRHSNEFEYSNMMLARLRIKDGRGNLVHSTNLAGLKDNHCGGTEERAYKLHGNCVLGVPVEVPNDGIYVAELDAWNQNESYPGSLTVWVPGYVYREGDTWYRDMLQPGFGTEVAPSAANSIYWLAEQIATDQRFAEATVKFWWPAIHGGEVLVPPAETGDADYQGLSVAAEAQASEISRLAELFRNGTGDRGPYNLKDLLVEMVLSEWFRAESLHNDHHVTRIALLNAGAKRLLTPEELANKTLAVTGFQWGRSKGQPWWNPRHPLNHLTGSYRTLYGGIDSDGITERALDMTPVMASVAKSHAVEVSCPIVLKDLYLLPDDERMLFHGIDQSITPVLQFGDTFEISGSGARWLKPRGSLSKGSHTLRLTMESGGAVRLYELKLRDVDGDKIRQRYLFEDHARTDCGSPRNDHFVLTRNDGKDCSITVPLEAPRSGTYQVEVRTRGQRDPSDNARLAVYVEGSDQNSNGAVRIKSKLKELYSKLLGIEIEDAMDSEDIDEIYSLFLEVWQTERTMEVNSFDDAYECSWPKDQYFLDGIVDDAWVRFDQDDGNWKYNWNWEVINPFFSELDRSDPEGIARTWTVVLMALLMDQRYLHL